MQARSNFALTEEGQPFGTFSSLDRQSLTQKHFLGALA